MPIPITPIEDRFWSFVIQHPTGCWEWAGSKTKWGYGRLGGPGRAGKEERAHRVSWSIHFGPIPDVLFVCHKCDNPECTRPDHLFLGTHTDNMNDCISKRRHRAVTARESYTTPRMGRPIGTSKFSAETRAEVIRRLQSGESHRAIEAALGVSRSMVASIGKHCLRPVAA